MSRAALHLAGLLVLVAVPAVAQSPRPYSEGPVTQVGYVRIKSGHFDEYMAYLAGPYKQLMEAEKKAGLITGWTVYSSPGRDEEDWDLALATTYKNMAALDDLTDRTDPIEKQVFGSVEKSNQGAVQRGAMRELVGTRLLRELVIR